jgi:hypothetical protein
MSTGAKYMWRMRDSAALIIVLSNETEGKLAEAD